MSARVERARCRPLELADVVVDLFLVPKTIDTPPRLEMWVFGDRVCHWFGGGSFTAERRVKTENVVLDEDAQRSLSGLGVPVPVAQQAILDALVEIASLDRTHPHDFVGAASFESAGRQRH